MSRLVFILTSLSEIVWVDYQGSSFRFSIGNLFCKETTILVYMLYTVVEQKLTQTEPFIYNIYNVYCIKHNQELNIITIFVMFDQS